MLKLYHNDMSVCAQKVRMVLAEKNLNWEGVHLNLRAGDQFKPEFVKLNSKAVVPVLVDGDNVILESNAIVEYLDEIRPDPPLMPADPSLRAKVRKWLIQLDANLHVDVARLSFAIAFRHQLIKACETDAGLEAYYAKTPDSQKRRILRDLVENGLDSEQVQGAVHAYEKLLDDMDRVLSESEWLMGKAMTLADIGYAPYITRLDHLNLGDWWEHRPAVQAWYDRIRATDAYKQGVGEWINDKYIGLMKEEGRAAWPRLQEILGEMAERNINA